MSSPWDNAANVATLKKLWAEGLTASQIANRIGSVTRNSVISKVHRLGLPGRIPSRAEADARNGVMARRMKARKKADRERRRAAPPPKAPEKPIQPRTAPEVPEPKPAQPPKQASGYHAALGGRLDAIPIMQLTELACRWPIGEPGEAGFHFCCRPAPFGQPYCAMDAIRSINPRQPKGRATPTGSRP